MTYVFFFLMFFLSFFCYGHFSLFSLGDLIERERKKNKWEKILKKIDNGIRNLLEYFVILNVEYDVFLLTKMHNIPRDACS
jgi:hypothetical protein